MLTITLSLMLGVLRGDWSNWEWQTDYSDAVRAVQIHDRPLFVYFDIGSSPLARQLHTGGFMSDQVERALAADYVRLFVDLDTDTGLHLAAKFGVTEYPRLVVIDRSGEWQVYRRSGAHTADEVLNLLNRYRRSRIYSTVSTSNTIESSFSGSSNLPSVSATNCKT